jgi:hypothetical protein
MVVPVEVGLSGNIASEESFGSYRRRTLRYNASSSTSLLAHVRLGLTSYGRCGETSACTLQGLARMASCCPELGIAVLTC